MTTAIHQALAAAGVPLPTVAQRVWNMVRDRPGSTCNDIAKRLNITRPEVSSRLADLEARKMLVATIENTLCPDGAKRRVKHFKTSMAEYEVLPRAYPKKPRKTIPVPASVAGLVKASVVEPPPTPTPTPLAPPPVPEPTQVTQDQMVREYIDGLSVSAARAMYSYLDSMFGRAR